MKKIVVAEDETEIRELIVFKLRNAGYTVYAATDGEGAVAVAERIGPDAVVLDWMMPRLSGLEVCQALRANEALAGIPIVMLTAKGQESDLQRAFAAGVDDYLVKPFSPKELVSRLDALLARARPR